MKGKRAYGLVFITVLLCALLFVGIVQAAGFNLTAVGASTTINGAIFEVFNPDDASGSGLFDAFVRVSSNQLVIEGYNTDYRPLQYQENNSGTFTKSLLLSAVPKLDVGGVIYREFQLDINQNTPIPNRYETLDTVELYESAFADLCGHPFDGSGGGHANCTSNNTAALIYDMDAGENNFIVLDYTNNEGSGKRDLKLLVPNSIFNQDPNCRWGGVGCTVYITLYSKFGGDSDADNDDPLLRVAHANNDGFEEWGVRLGVPTAITLGSVTTGSGSDRALAAAAGFGVLMVASVSAVTINRRRNKEK